MGMLDSLTGWARRHSAWDDTLVVDSILCAELEAPTGLIYRLRHWPELPPSMRIAAVLKLLSLMCSRPVSRSWMNSHSRVPHQRLVALLRLLEDQDALEIINPASFPPEPRGGRHLGCR